ncbi:unnamed protein product [Gadus morhua 'NCC']
MALLSFVVPNRLKLVLMLLIIYNVGSSAAVICSDDALGQLDTDVENLNKTLPHFPLNINSSEQQNCTHLYFETGLAQLKKTCSEDLKINGLIEELIKRFKYEKCLRDLSDVTGLKCMKNTTSYHFMDQLKNLSQQLNNIAKVIGRRRRRRRRSVWNQEAY